MKFNLVVALVLAIIPTFVHAVEEDRTRSIASRYTKYHISYNVNPDGAHVETHERALKVIEERALERAKQTSISYSTSVQKAEIVEAYTLKADGKKISVPKDNFQLEVGSGHGSGNPAISDITTLTVIFPDVAVGDSTVISYRLTQSEAIFPGEFSESKYFPKAIAYDDVRIILDFPKEMSMQHEARNMEENSTEKNGRKIITLKYKNQTPLKSKRRNYSLYDENEEPGYAFSTFQSYKEIAEVYGVRATPKAAVTQRIRQLAEEITKGKEGEIECARALYDWVATNISYAGNCIGVGSVVPRDLEFVLDNKMGDCKDHATLYQALLSAKGIQSTQALINSGTSFKLGHIPLVSSVNHVISYIPSLKTFADTTAEIIPFGFLSPMISGKPVLLVEDYTEGMQTPIPSVDMNQQTVKTNIQLHPDGSASIQVEVAYRGLWAAYARAQLRDIPKDYEEQLIPETLKTFGFVGTGTLEREDTKVLLDRFNLTATMEVKNYIQPSGAGALSIYPLLPTEAPIQHFVRSATEYEETADVLCGAGRSTEDYMITFPKDRQILSIPADFSAEQDFAAYKATSSQKGNTVMIRRDFNDQTKGNICSVDYSRKFHEFVTPLVPKIREQILYK